jgi:flagellar hook protein FlgE
MSGSALYTGVSGMAAQQQRMDVIANDIANMNTVGYKESTATFQEALIDSISMPAVGTPGRQLGLGVRVSMTQRNFNNGAMTETGLPTQFAIQGRGFFVVQATDASGDPSGTRFYTRAGDFTMNVRDDATIHLINSSGYALIGNDDQPINLRQGMDPAVQITSFSVAQNGTISTFGSDGSTTPVGTIPVVEFANANALTGIGSTMFQWTAAANPSEPTLGGANSPGINIIQGYLESSNVDLTREFSDLIITQRGFQANSKTITTADEMMQAVLNLKR